MSGTDALVAALTQKARQRAAAPPAFRFGMVSAVAGGVATVSVGGASVPGVPCYVPGVTVGAQVLLLAQGTDLLILGVKQ